MSTERYPLVPYPRRVEGSGALRRYRAGVRCPQDGLRAAAALLADHVGRLTGQPFPAGEGDFELILSPDLAAEDYTLCAEETVRLTGGGYAGVCRGLATLLQLIRVEGDGLYLPRLMVEDGPDRGYRGLMVDLARRWHPLGQLLTYVDLCFYYKINHLHLHLTDDEAFTFPSRTLPKLVTPIHHYTRAQLTYLINYAEDRGVTLVPEIDLPGHARPFGEAYPQLFSNDPAAPGLLCLGRPGAPAALNALVGELCEAFPRSPLIHVGGDEAQTQGWADCSHCRGYMADQGIADVQGLYAHAVAALTDSVRRRGRRPVVWEGFAPEAAQVIGKDVVVMPFESRYFPPDGLAAAGYDLINTAWKPLYVTPTLHWPPVDIYNDWDLYRWGNWLEASAAWPDGITLAPTDRVLGAQLCLWETCFEEEWPRVRSALAALSERVWTVERRFPVLDFLARYGRAERRLLALLVPPFRAQDGKDQL